MKKYENFCKALENLKIVRSFEKPYTIVSLAATSSLFTVCFELSWKLIKETLEYHGYFTNKTGSPRLIIKSAYQCGMIDDEECWLDILNTRSLLAHTYDENSVKLALDKCKERYIEAFEKLKQTIDENWSNI